MKAVPYNQINGGHKGFVPRSPARCYHQRPLSGCALSLSSSASLPGEGVGELEEDLENVRNGRMRRTVWEGKRNFPIWYHPASMSQLPDNLLSV